MLSKTPANRTGFSLIETAVSTLLVSILLVTSLSTSAHVLRVSHHPDVRRQAAVLAQIYLSEITSKPFDSPSSPSVALGLDAGESHADRLNLDDCDDYHSLSQATLTYENGDAIPNTNGWSAAVTVRYSDPLNPLTTVNNPTDLKLITLVLEDPQGQSQSFQAFRSKQGPLLDPQATPILSSIRVQATTATGQELRASARVLNQQAKP